MQISEIDNRISALVHRDQELVRCPHQLFSAMREHSPVHYSDELGAWVLTRYEDCLSVLHDPITWSVRMRTGPRPINSVLGARIEEIALDPSTTSLTLGIEKTVSRNPILSSADPPVHSRQRKLVSARFKPSRIMALEPLIEQVARRLLHDISDTSEIEFVRQFAVPLPMSVIADSLGIGDDNLEQFKRWSDDLVMPVGNQHPTRYQVERYLRTQVEFGEFFSRKLSDRKSNPRDDLISDIANAKIDDEPLVESDQLDIIGQLLSAGNETTTKLITTIIWYLAKDPDLQHEVRADRSLILPLVEEIMRLEAPVSGLFRRATTNTEIGGQQIKKGEHVWVLYVAANHDKDRFTNPNMVDLERGDGKDHLGFGHGHHYCLGAGLARAEARIATHAVLDTFDRFRPHERNDYLFEDSYLLRGLKALHLSCERHQTPI